MPVRVFIWQVGRSWLAQCPSLQCGGRGKTRGEALRALRTEVRNHTEVEIIDGKPPPMEDA
jgi:hypothetical protein